MNRPDKSRPRGRGVQRKTCELLDDDGICIPSKTYREKPFPCTRPHSPETCGIFLEMRRTGKITTPVPPSRRSRADPRLKP